MKKSTYKTILKLRTGFCVLASCAFAGTYIGLLANEEVYTANNQLFSYDKVVDDLKFYGGDEGYVRRGASVTHFVNGLVCHLDTGHNDRIVVGYDAGVPDEDIEQYNLFFDYLNSTFEIINPSYKFITTKATKENCDIFIKSCSFEENLDLDYNALAITQYDYNVLNSSIIKGGTIYVNTDYYMTNTKKRFTMAHEFYHILSGADDLTTVKEFHKSVSYPMSVFAYVPSAHIVSAINHSYDPETERQIFSSQLPMDSQIKESYVSYMPFDLSGLISIYGDSSKGSNVVKYLTLLNDKLQECRSLFTDENPFYKEGYLLPEIYDEADKMSETEENEYNKPAKKNENYLDEEDDREL